ncbi:MAG: hypothetical protein EXQ59_00090 [Acidobacteria bacterium]|nr:hypothetical protein [Acidobacteriota bacterium]
MKKHSAKLERLRGLQEMLSDYRRMTIEETEATSWGDREIEIEGEVWRLEMELLAEHSHRTRAA